VAAFANKVRWLECAFHREISGWISSTAKPFISELSL